MTATTTQMQECIDNCGKCHAMCLSMATNFCLEKGGDHVGPGHFRLMLDCAQICAVSVDFMLRNSKHAPHVCAECADICDDCADSCRVVGDMDECVEACRACARLCRMMPVM